MAADDMAAELVADPHGGRSRLTPSPGFQLPSVVFDSVSPEAVAANQQSLAVPLSTTVWQMPAQAMEAPSSIRDTS